MKLAAACAVLAALAAESQAFVPTGPSLRPASFGGPAPMIASRVRTASSLLPLRMASSADSELVKSDLLSQLSVGTGLKVAAEGDRVKINELLMSLEPKNPTEDPAMSPLLNGVWELLYTGGYGPGVVDSPTREIALLLYTGGYRPGLVSNLLSRLPAPIAPLFELDDLELTIQRGAPRIDTSAKLRVFGNEEEIHLKNELVAESGVRLRETFSKAEGFGQSLDLAGPFKYSRTLFVTYLDDDVLVARDESGVPDIWVRKAKDFWVDEAEKVEVMPEPASPVDVANPEVKINRADYEPEWTKGEDDDVGPSDY